MKRIFSIVAALLFFSSPSINAQSDAGAIFLLISPGARAGGMGEAQVAVANDAYASYWNPLLDLHSRKDQSLQLCM